MSILALAVSEEPIYMSAHLRGDAPLKRPSSIG